MKRYRNVIFLTMAVLLVTGFAFFNSFQNSSTSNGATDSVIGFLAPVLNVLNSLFGELDWFFLIRKAAHLTEFCVLGIFALNLAHEIASLHGRPFTAHAVCYVLSVAVMDECIQSFSDRTSSVYDVLIDVSGALIGFGIVTVIRILRRKHNERVVQHGD